MRAGDERKSSYLSSHRPVATDLSAIRLLTGVKRFRSDARSVAHVQLSCTNRGLAGPLQVREVIVEPMIFDVVNAGRSAPVQRSREQDGRPVRLHGNGNRVLRRALCDAPRTRIAAAKSQVQLQESDRSGRKQLLECAG